MKEQEKQNNPFQSLRLPFLGCRENGEPFEYLLMEIDQNRANIAISKWMINRTILNLKEKINLFVPGRLTLEYDFRNHSLGIITSISEESITQEDFYGISFIHPFSVISSENWSIDQLSQNLLTDVSVIDLLLGLIKDSLLLKQGILVYLKHFAPYFSRIVDYSVEDYVDLKKFLFVGIANIIQKNVNALENFYHFSKRTIKSIHDISIVLNLEELREISETEINLDLFVLSCTDLTSREELIDLLNKPTQAIDYNRNNKYLAYLMAIKNLEKRLYSNYNQLVLIYLKSVNSS